jgi:hypothetical protein
MYGTIDGDQSIELIGQKLTRGCHWTKVGVTQVSKVKQVTIIRDCAVWWTGKKWKE